MKKGLISAYRVFFKDRFSIKQLNGLIFNSLELILTVNSQAVTIQPIRLPEVRPCVFGPAVGVIRSTGLECSGLYH